MNTLDTSYYSINNRYFDTAYTGSEEVRAVCRRLEWRYRYAEDRRAQSQAWFAKSTRISNYTKYKPILAYTTK